MTDDYQVLPPGPALVRAATIVIARYDALAAECGLTPQQARLLFVLYRRPSNMLGLGATERLGRSTMTGVIGRMERAGLVERSPDPLDRRNLLVTPTVRGIELIKKFETGLKASVATLLDPLSAPERTQLAVLLSAIVRADELRQ